MACDICLFLTVNLSLSLSLSLSLCSYTVFGLGNKTYEHYNEMSRVVDRLLAKLGANRVYKAGEGDDDAK